ncbi:insulin-like growth factor-binding protein complex acid labile subunit [Plutella xylostella]|uniref:insulin-like growth factor-binding protein complex acid labile subunit n=1 Tax=Plutella xylostella TaxID=51655 RepID=UPI0020324C58|nr:insulin-like growth factor-binding protein complex acid labile subunit [Plutella xylostella]
MVVLLRSIGALLCLTAVAGTLDYEDNDPGGLCNVCLCSEDLVSVDCSSLGLTDIPPGGSSKVQRLNASNNEITSFPRNLNRFPNLGTLDLSGNQLSTLPADALFNLTNLDLLNLSRNAFEVWLNLNPNEVLLLATSLRVLDLSNNRFTSLGNLENQELFVSNSLEILILEKCAIATIHGRSPLLGLSNLKVLRLSHNPLRRIHSLMSSTLRLLDVSNCQLSYIHHDSLVSLPSLITLQMSHNFRLVLATTTETLLSDSLRYLDISYCNVMQPSLEGFPNLRKAYISHNMVRYLTSMEFVNNTKLEYLDLSYNSISSIKRDTFRGLLKLKYLDLSWNEIPALPEDALLETPELSQINLSRNYFTKVGHLKSLSVTVMDMSQCEISMIGKDSLEGLQSLIDINLSRNLLSHIPDSISSNTLQKLNLNYNRISAVNNYTFFMLPRLTSLSVTGNRFTTIWHKAYFQSNPYLDNLDLDDNMWRCDCSYNNMYDFFEYVTLEPNKKEESYKLICNSPSELFGKTWFDACYMTWVPGQQTMNADGVVWFLFSVIVGLTLVFLVVSAVKRSMKRRLEAIQAERERQVEEARDRLRQMRIRAEQEAQCNAPDPRDLVPPPSYIEALSMPKLNTSCYSLNEAGSGKSKKRRGRRKTKSSGDLLEETERNGDVRDEFEMVENTDDRRRRRRRRSAKYGSHEIAELDQSPGARRRRMSEYEAGADSITVEVEAEMERPLRPRNRRNSIDDDEPRESDF